MAQHENPFAPAPFGPAPRPRPRASRPPRRDGQPQAMDAARARLSRMKTSIAAGSAAAFVALVGVTAMTTPVASATGQGGVQTQPGGGASTSQDGGQGILQGTGGSASGLGGDTSPASGGLGTQPAIVSAPS